MAKRRENGWMTEADPTAWERSFQIVDLARHELQLKAIAIGDFDRHLHHADAMPERPAIAK